MTKQTLVAFAAVIMAGCAAPIAREASMDWATFITSVPGTMIGDATYKTPTLKRSAYRADTPGLEQTKDSFGAWCKTHHGKAVNMPPLHSTGITQSFYNAARAWSNQELVLNDNRYRVTTLFCLDTQQLLTAVMMVRSHDGYRHGPYEPDKLPAPTIAFYTPAQAAQFADFYNQKEQERTEAALRKIQQRSDRQAEATHRLRTTPKLGDQTSEGMIIELRPPLALIQYNALQRQMFGKPQQEWVPIVP